ncbi:MAG: tetratricopeptide repeat protein [Candidatus Fermentibacteraceae bacterium]|nr:tetratricopeptide repeat protein [Candidatus Fermentibacteraceae bacterium]
MERPFVDRTDERSHLRRALKYDGSENPVLVFTGIGGMGKTALRIDFENQALKPDNVPFAAVDYDTDPNLKPIESTLRAMRRQLGRQGVRTPVFDFLYARYFELSMGVKISAQNCPHELESVVNILEGIPAVGSVAQVIHGLSQLGLSIKERLRHKEWLYRLRELEPREVLNLLPEAMAGDLEEAVSTRTPKVLKSSGSRIVLLLDAYERLAEAQLDDALHRKLLSLTPHLLRVVLTRDPLPWDLKFPSEWSGRIIHVPSLEDLCSEDTKTLLREKSVDDPDLQEHLYRLTGGYPFHLELCSDICREIAEATGRKPKTEDFQGTAQARDLTEELVDRLLRQLNDDERDLMGLACYPRWISEEVLEELSSVPESVSRIYRKFMQLSMFSPHPEIADAAVLRQEVRDCLLSKQLSKRWFRKRHGKLSEFHAECWEETGAFHHLQEALYHGFYEDSERAVEVFEKHFWQLLEKCQFAEAGSLLESVPHETLDEKAKRKVDYARARLLTGQAGSQQSLLTANGIYESLIAGENDEESLGLYLFSFGELQCCQGDYAKALEYGLKALEIRRKVFGEEHPDVAASHHNVGDALYEQGEYSEALEHYEKALAIRRGAYGEEHPDVADSLNDMCIINRELGRYSEALAYGRKSLDIRRKIFGEEAPAAAIPLVNIGSVHYYRSEYGEALDYYQRGLAIMSRVYGEEHPKIAILHNNIGSVCQCLGDYEKALEHARKSLSMDLNVYGEEHPNVADSYHNIGTICYRKGEYEKALDYYQKSLAIRVRISGPEHPRVSISYHNIGIIHKEQGEYATALEYFRKSLDICLKFYGDEHPGLAGSYYEIACCLYALNEVDQAFESIRKSIERYLEFDLWKSVPEALYMLAQWLDEQGKSTEAQEARREALKICDEHDMPDLIAELEEKRSGRY